MQVVGEDEDPTPRERPADAHMVQSTRVSQGHRPVVAHDVAAHAEVSDRERTVDRECLRQRRVDHSGGLLAERSMGSDLVVIAAKLVELHLQLCDRTRTGLFGQPLLERLVEALDLAAGLGVVRPRVSVLDASFDELALEGDVTGVTKSSW